MKEIVIVPTYDRPEYLWMCLQKLSQAGGIERKEIWVCEDVHKSEKDSLIHMEMRHVSDVGDMRFPDRFRWIRREPHSSYGNSFNVLEAFREALKSKAEHIYLVEDDVLVMPDFFKWHEAAQDQFHPFVSCAGRINNSLNFERNGREAIDESCKDPLACVASKKAYGSWAACFPAQSVQHILREVWSQKFCDHIGPGNEQDIFIQRLMPRVFKYSIVDVPIFRKFDVGLSYADGCVTSGFSVWPYVPRAYHMGMSSYHRTCGLSFNGTLSEKIEALRATVSSREKIRNMALLQNDIDPYPINPVENWAPPLYLKADYR